ncbi:MAG TPA: cytochrome c3 family protein [Candidatus Acidoferrales bacterium]|nr:cytochrome c3 family protein [Candidatus Acidoferrales bacterium]
MKRVAAAVLFTATELFAVSSKLALVGSQHDLTATGGGPVKSAQADTCIFCHAPHNVSPNVTPLWDQTLSSQSYTTYTSSTYGSGAQTPGAGSSKLCLSCHDGTVAVGLTVTKGLITTSGAMAATDILGVNLSTSHPVSMTPVDDGSLAASLFANTGSTKDPAVTLVSGKVECTTCHDPHVPRNDPVVPMFLARANSNGALCLACHDPARVQPNVLSGWTTAAHATASNTVPAAASFGSYGTVALNACSNCHGAHNNAAAPRNLRALEEAACAPCHSGANASPALQNVLGEFTKTYKHPTTTVSGAHDPAEPIPVNSTRHAECADCHNPHAASAQTGTPVAPLAQASLSGVSGYDTTGVQRPATKEYQLCYKCHADSTNKPAIGTFGRTAIRYPGGPMPAGYPIQPPRPPDQYNLRLKFTGTVGHNVAGSNVVTTSVSSLRPFMLYVDGVTSNSSRPLTTSSIVYCTDCHNNDQARSSNGAGPNGPHGSAFPHLLQLNLFQDSAGGGGGGGGGGGSGSALCNKCHTLNTVGRESPHDKHNGVGCTTCHDPHGVIGGNAGANRAMINLDTGVAASSRSNFGYFYLGAGSGQKGCYTTCHGENHNPHTY